jgi:hypothetical protein
VVPSFAYSDDCSGSSLLSHKDAGQLNQRSAPEGDISACPVMLFTL